MVQLQEVIKSHFGWWEMSQATQFRKKAVSIAPILPWDFWALTYLLLPSNQILYLSLFSLGLHSPLLGSSFSFSSPNCGLGWCKKRLDIKI